MAGILSKIKKSAQAGAMKAAQSPTLAIPGAGSPVMKEGGRLHQAEMAKPIPGKATGPAFPKGLEGKTYNQQFRDTEMNPLTDNERAEIVNEIVVNSAGQFEGMDEVIGNFSDEQLLALNEQTSVFAETRLVLNQIMRDFEIPGDLALNALPQYLREFVESAVHNAAGAAFDGGSGGGEPEGGKGEGTRANGKDDDSYDESAEDDSELDDSDGEGEYEGDTGKTGISHNNANAQGDRNVKPRKLTVNQWLNAAQAPPEIKAMVRNQIRQDQEKKAEMIETITANESNTFSDEQLNAMTTEQLEPIANLAKKPVKGQVRQPVRNSAPANGHNRLNSQGRTLNFAGAAAPVNNQQVNNASDDDLLDEPTINWKKNAEEIKAGTI